MSLFSFLRKKKQESSSNDGEFYSRAEEESSAVRARGKRQAKQAAEPVDPVLPEKKRARRRLVGAIALVLAAIIGLPMLLDSEPKQLADDIAIQIPSRDKPVNSSGSLPIAPAPAAAPASSVSAAGSLDQQEQIVEPSAVAAAPAKMKEAGDAPKPPAEHTNVAAKTEQKPADAKTADVKPALKPEQKANVGAETKTAVKPPQAADKVDDTARAQSILEGKADAKESPTKTVTEKKTKFAVQVAALATQEKITELRDKLKEAGIQSYTQKVATESGERTRIRVGPFAGKEEADKMRAKLVKLGLNGTLVPNP